MNKVKSETWSGGSVRFLSSGSLTPYDGFGEGGKPSVEGSARPCRDYGPLPRMMLIGSD